MRRRDFIAGVAGSAVSWPLAAGAQQQAMPVIGFLRSAPFTDAKHLVAAFRQGMKEAGFVEGQNVAIEYRSAENNHDRLSALVAELIRRQVAVIVGNTPSAHAAKAATTTVPIVFATGGDPVRDGLVASLSQPGANITGVSFFGALLGAKRLELLRQLVPKATTIAMLVNPNIPNAVAEQRDVQAAALAIGQQLIIVDVSGARQIEMAFATFVQRGAGALLVGPGAPLNSNRELLVALAARHALGRPGLGSMIARRIALCRAVRPHAKDSHLDRSCQSQPQREIDRVASSYRTARVRKWHSSPLRRPAMGRLQLRADRPWRRGRRHSRP